MNDSDELKLCSIDPAIKNLGYAYVHIMKHERNECANPQKIKIKSIGRVAMDYSEALRSYSVYAFINKISEDLDECDVILIEEQPFKNKKSFVVQCKLIGAIEQNEHWRGKLVRSMNATAKNNVCFDGLSKSQVKEAIGLKKGYVLNKKHTVENLKHFCETTQTVLDVRGKIDDIADAFMMAVAYAVLFWC